MLLERLDPAPSLEDAIAALSGWPHLAVFDSARRGEMGRWSFLTADPWRVTTVEEARPGDRLPTFDVRQKGQTPIVMPREAPPFCGGTAGVIGYDFGRLFERLERPPIDEFALPAAVVGQYDWSLAWDHERGDCWLASSGVRGFAAELGFARKRRRQVLAALDDPQPTRPNVADPIAIATPQHSLPGSPGVTTNKTAGEYAEAVGRMRQAIAAGDIFQANLSQRLLCPARCDALTLYRTLREVNPAPMAGYFDAGDWQIASASPERFLSIDGRRIQTRPIKGTYRRSPRPEADLFTRDALRESEKDRAENVMIVDLLRNDLSRVCEPGSMRVPALCEIETFENVQHLVSTIEADLKAGLTPIDALAAAFPGGSISGCPKIMAMDWITRLEGVARGPYCGTLFYWGHDREGVGARFDASILIRTVIAAGGWWQMAVGGGITFGSDPAAEHQETLDKAAGMLAAVGAISERSRT